ncbi:MAG: nucleotidyltransferase domain-containing protein [Bacteroidales bacterium]|nr:nucleotidyltransferase domain-containing protein [Bacteroidales bacterium]
MISKRVNTMVPKIQAVLSGKPVIRAWIFGSYSRGEETPQSDIDILVQYDAGSSLSLLDISRIMVELSKALGVRVDLVEEGRLLPFAAQSANHDKILVYERAS